MNIPDWLNKEVWEGFVEMRRKVKAPLTERAMRLTINKLERMREEGYDPNLSLDESTMRGWRGVFPQGERSITDKSGMRYRVTAEGFREYIQ